MKSKKTKKSIFVSIFSLISYILVIIFIDVCIVGTELSYSEAMTKIENNLNQVTEISVSPKNNEVTILMNENGHEKEYTSLVPDSEAFMNTVMNLKSENKLDFNVSISKPMSTYFWNWFKYFLIYVALRFIGKFIYELFEKDSKSEKDTKKDESDEKQKPEFKISFGNEDGKKTAFTDFSKLLGKDYSDEIQSHVAKDVKVNFEDVAGMENAKSDLMDIATGILNAKEYEKFGAKIPSGILLEGAPGTGKTLLAKALAGEVKVPFIQYSATEMSDKFVGESEEKVRQIFNYAKKNAPCIIFFDEIDAIATSRKKDTASYEKKLLNQLLTCLDGFTPRDGVIFIAATNFVESLDEAIKRPGRFDRIIHVDLPNMEEREAILKVHARNKKLSSEIDLKDLARNTATLSGAYLANILNEAVIIQMKGKHECITPEDLNEAHRKVLFGAKSSKKMSFEEKHLTAIHELGHAVTSNEIIKEISIVPRGNMGGYTWYNHKEESYITATKIKEKLISFLGGRAAEEVILGEISTGAQNDMERAWKLAYDYITKYGMSDLMGPISIKANSMSDTTKEIIFEETKKMISTAYDTAISKIQENRQTIESVSQILESKETILGEEFYEIIKPNNISV